MNRRQFLESVLASPLLMLPKNESITGLQKGAHITPTFIPEIINAVGLDAVVGTDEVIMDTYSGQARYLSSLNCEYIARIPDDFNSDIVSNIRSIPSFHNKWELLNEPNRWGITPQQAAQQFVVDYQLIRSVSPSPQDYFCLSAGSQEGINGVADNPLYLDQMLSYLTPTQLGWIDAIGIHYYPATLDPAEVFRFARAVRGVMNKHGLNDTRGWITEIGFDDRMWRVDQIAAYLPPLFTMLSQFSWLERIHFYLANGQTDWIEFGQNKLNAVGRAFRDA